MKTLKKIWAWLNGNKTIIGSLLLTATAKWGDQVIGANMVPIVEGVIALLTGAALWHHGQKGYLTTKKGD